MGSIEEKMKKSSMNNNFEYTDANSNKLGEVGEIMVLETEAEKRGRNISLSIIYFTTFVQSLGFSIILTGVWPYLQQVESEPNKELLGWVIAANPIGQLIFSPLIGWLCTYLNSIRVPSIFCLILFICSNVWYSLLPLHSQSAQYFMIISRFLVGISSGSIAACRTFVTQETKLIERTPKLAYLSLFQAVGFMVGPGIQVILTKLGPDGIQLFGNLTFSMYTGPGWISALLGIINIILYHPKFLKESNIAEKEYELQNETELLSHKEKFDWDNHPPDYVAIGSLIVSFFAILFNFSLLEALGAPAIMDQFGWSDTRAIQNLGTVMTISSFLSMCIFYMVGYLSKRYDERKLLVFCGLIPMLISRVFFFPFPGPVAPMQKYGCMGNNSLVFSFEKEECLGSGLVYEVVSFGCPEYQSWCFSTSALTPTLLTIGFFIGTLGYPFCVTIPQTLYSKVIGPRPQGTWNGALSAVVSLSKILGALLLVHIYQKYGTIHTSGLATGLLVLSILISLIFHKRFVPFKLPEDNKF